MRYFWLCRSPWGDFEKPLPFLVLISFVQLAPLGLALEASRYELKSEGVITKTTLHPNFWALRHKFLRGEMCFAASLHKDKHNSYRLLSVASKCVCPTNTDVNLQPAPPTGVTNTDLLALEWRLVLLEASGQK